MDSLHWCLCVAVAWCLCVAVAWVTVDCCGLVVALFWVWWFRCSASAV